MSEKQIIAVVGATGAQGGGLVHAILDDPQGPFIARAVVRDPKSEKAQALARRGAQVVAGDLDDPASIERAFAGAHGAYCVTFYWAHMSPDTEAAHARTLAQAAKQAGVKHAIWSTLEDTRLKVPLASDRMPTLMGRFKVPHLDVKGEADHRFTEAGVPTTFLLTSFYWDNFIHFGMGPRRGEDGTLSVALPMGERRLAGIAAADIGRAALGIFKQGAPLVGKTVGIAGEHLTGTAIAETFTRVYGETVRYQAVPFEVYRGLGFPGADDLGNMFQYFHDFEADFLAARDLAGSRRLIGSPQTLESFLAEHKGAIPVA